MLTVTGATGFVGSNLVERLSASGVDVLCLTRQTSKTSFIDSLNVRLKQVDFDNVASLTEALKGTDVVVHIAGVIHALSSAEYFKGNWLVTRNLVSAAKAARVKRFIYVSSLAAAGPCNGSSAKTEDDYDAPVSLYGKSKLAGENEVRKFSDWVIVRPPIIFGRRDTGMLTIFKALSVGIAPNFGGNKYYSMLYIDDLTDCLVRLSTERSDVSNEKLYVSYDKPFAMTAICSAASRNLNSKCRSIYVPMKLLEVIADWLGSMNLLNRDKLREIRQKRWVCSNSKARRLGLIKGLTPYDEAMAQTISWYKKEKLL